MKPQPNRWRSS